MLPHPEWLGESDEVIEAWLTHLGEDWRRLYVGFLADEVREHPEPGMLRRNRYSAFDRVGERLRRRSMEERRR